MESLQERRLPSTRGLTPPRSELLADLARRVDRRAVGVGAWAVALIGWVYVRFGPYGFNPSDEGFIISQSRRVLHGAVPHADVISPRPLGSAYLHIVDLLLPMPLHDAMRLVSCIEMGVVAALFAWLLFGRPPWRWTAVEALGWGVAYLVNVHTFPLMPWHTVDGLLFLGAGLVVLERALRGEDRRALVAAFALLGAAPLMKQVFVPAPLLGVAWLAWQRRGELGRFGRDLAWAAGAAALPGIAYVLVVVAGGGWSDMVVQLQNSAHTTGWPPIDYFRLGPAAASDRHGLLNVLAAVGVGVTGGLAMLAVADRLAAVKPERAALLRLAGVAVRIASVAVIANAAFDQHLVQGWTWASKLLWGAVFAVGLRSAVRRSFDGRAALVIAAAVLASLSWGYAVPNLMAGSLLLCLGHCLLRGSLPARAVGTRAVRGAAAGLAVVLTATTMWQFADGRSRSVYFDLDEPELAASLRSVDADFGRLRTSPNTLHYVVAVRDCLRRYPARNVAIVPDNPGLYAVFDLHNPFPIDWMLPAEVRGSEARLRRAADEVDERGDYLVLFETFSVFILRELPAVADATATTRVPIDNPAVKIINDTLSGERITCGPFVGRYRP